MFESVCVCTYIYFSTSKLWKHTFLKRGFNKEMLSKSKQEFPLWHSRNESDKEPRGCGFDPQPCSAD